MNAMMYRQEEDRREDLLALEGAPEAHDLILSPVSLSK